VHQTGLRKDATEQAGMGSVPIASAAAEIVLLRDTPAAGVVAGLLVAFLALLVRAAVVLPWRAVEFLEEMTRLGLLRRAGSGHLFPHRLVMEYFAALPADDVLAPAPATG
jgi:hypothetical protein